MTSFASLPAKAGTAAEPCDTAAATRRLLKLHVPQFRPACVYHSVSLVRICTEGANPSDSRDRSGSLLTHETPTKHSANSGPWTSTTRKHRKSRDRRLFYFTCTSSPTGIAQAKIGSSAARFQSAIIEQDGGKGAAKYEAFYKTTASWALIRQ